jgi:hypothetical protein
MVLYTEVTFKVYGLDQFLQNKLDYYQNGWYIHLNVLVNRK